MTETDKFLISQMKQSGIRLNFFARSNFNGVLKYPKVISGNKALAKFILEKRKFTFIQWVKN